MFEKGTYVIYGKRGVCRVEDIGAYFKESMHDKKEYYKLSPVFTAGDQVYVPVETQVYMREVLTPGEVRDYIEEVEEIPADTFTCRQQSKLADHYRRMLDTNDMRAFLALIKGVYVKQFEAGKKNRKLNQVEQKFLKFAEDMAFGEFAVVLDSTPDEIRSYVRGRVLGQFQEPGNGNALGKSNYYMQTMGN